MMMRLVFKARVAKSGDRFVISIPKRLSEKASKLHMKEVIVIVEELD
ncbi:MAG: hypothetical protein OCU16_05015 [Candidatus Methanospirare jalkutatii]|nr:hypothetical protein [Candidatus Methanospirare jalkutatii]